MSHWIESFTLVEAASKTPVLRFDDSTWSLDTAEWLGESLVKMTLRKYPGDHIPSSFEVRVDCEAKAAEIEGSSAMPLPNVEQALKERYLSPRGQASNQR